jgi:hypothetical protein
MAGARRRGALLARVRVCLASSRACATANPRIPPPNSVHPDLKHTHTLNSVLSIVLLYFERQGVPNLGAESGGSGRTVVGTSGARILKKSRY